MSNSILPYGWMLLAALAFATMGTLVHALGDTCDWQVIALARTGLALVFSTALAAAAGARLVFLRPRTLWIRSIAGSISLVCTFHALTHLPVADVLTLTNVFPIWVARLSWPLLREVPGNETWIAIACGIFGVVLVQQPHFQDEANSLAAMLALFSSFTTAISMLGLHRLQEIDPRAIVVHFSAVSFVVCLVWLLVAPNMPVATSQFDAQSILLLLGVGICATIGQIFLTKAFAAGPPARVSVIGLTQVGFAILFDVVLWGRSISATTLVGMALVTAPTAWLLVSQGRAQVDDL